MSERTQHPQRYDEVLFHLFVETVADYAIFAMDRQGHVVHWNEGAARLTGYSAADVLGYRLDAIFTPEDRQAGTPRMELETAERFGRAADERWHVRKNGGRFWGLGVVTPIRAPDGALLGFGKIMRDRTDLKELEVALKRQNEALARADEHKDQFIATLAHELRNPQSVIANCAGLLRRYSGDDTHLQAVADMIERQVRQTTRLVDDLVDLARSTHGKMQLDLQRLDLRELVRAAAETMSSLIDERRHSLHVIHPDTPVEIDGDAGRIQQILINLLTNAARYTAPGGRISLSVAVEGGDAVVRVQDTGAGIPPEQLASIFELFTQAHAQNVESRAGLGIGLALVRELVSLHRGTIQARSDGPGRGSEFIVRLPSATKQPGSD
jgi:two-component system, chemotaxis family, CheB/CheR fusion protein